mmetsp:Transcript_37174/g.86430  ORF Transcript_37174/g.86430 Transcript_37174/m.86430 type:complete len:229 (-) Transcript_37174:20-706(-)
MSTTPTTTRPSWTRAISAWRWRILGAASRSPRSYLLAPLIARALVSEISLCQWVRRTLWVSARARLPLCCGGTTPSPSRSSRSTTACWNHATSSSLVPATEAVRPLSASMRPRGPRRSSPSRRAPGRPSTPLLTRPSPAPPSHRPQPSTTQQTRRSAWRVGTSPRWQSAPPSPTLTPKSSHLPPNTSVVLRPWLRTPISVSVASSSPSPTRSEGTPCRVNADLDTPDR